MSIWTHVVGCIRVDGLPSIAADKFNVAKIEAILGPMCMFDKWNDASILPKGSEGGLQYRIIEYSDGLPWLAIPIWGNLRDFDNVEEIDKWWQDIISKLGLVRDAILRIQVENRQPVILSKCGNTAFRIYI